MSSDQGEKNIQPQAGQIQEQAQGNSPTEMPIQTPEQTPTHMPTEEMSAEEMDAFLKQNDPEFMSTVQQISEDKTLSVENLEDDGEGKATIGFRVKAFFIGLFVRAKIFSFYLVKEALPRIKKQIKGIIHDISDAIDAALHTFKYLKWQIKIVFFASCIFVIAALFVAYKSIKRDFIREDKPLFISSLAEYASNEYDYDPKEVEPYINNARAAQNVVMTRKIFVNLKPSPGSGPNPMAAFEFFIEGMTSDVVIEIKDREPKVHDLIERTIEDSTFEELDSEQGKKALCQRLQEEITKILTTGSVRVVRIKTVILKP